MNNLHNYFKITAIVLFTFLFQGCLKNNDDYSSATIGTVHFTEEDPSALYFNLDSKEQLYPNSLNFSQASKLKEKDRVFIEYKDATGDKNEYFADIVGVIPIPTKEIHSKKTKDELELLLEQSDLINISEVYIVNGFITLKYTYIGGDVSKDKHNIDLYALTETKESDQTLRFYLTHDANEDKGTSQRTGIITFSLDNLQDLIGQTQQSTIKSHTIYEGIKEYQIKATDIHK